MSLINWNLGNLDLHQKNQSIHLSINNDNTDQQLWSESNLARLCRVNVEMVRASRPSIHGTRQFHLSQVSFQLDTPQMAFGSNIPLLTLFVSEV